MLASLLIVFREVLEAGLIVGVVLAAIKGVPRRGNWTIGGIAAGILCAILVIPFAEELKEGFFGKPIDGIYIHQMFGFESDENRVRSHKKWSDYIAAKKGGDKKEK